MPCRVNIPCWCSERAGRNSPVSWKSERVPLKQSVPGLYVNLLEDIIDDPVLGCGATKLAEIAHPRLVDLDEGGLFVDDVEFAEGDELVEALHRCDGGVVVVKKDGCAEGVCMLAGENTCRGLQDGLAW